eukprot:TRINITY_DN11109_c0_g1_i1.p1 TRINITY_DN11109_c0_g1~~TRINITY_DN11109_c0_g1_i1.p1  ORF type:complete len:1791 (-),score=276.77 TRINITY_DN11109_c0_g1_i1:96-5468(-)
MSSDEELDSMENGKNVSNQKKMKNKMVKVDSEADEEMSKSHKKKSKEMGVPDNISNPFHTYEHKHELKFTTGLSRHYCNLCEDLIEDGKAFRCEACDYDICLRKKCLQEVSKKDTNPDKVVNKKYIASNEHIKFEKHSQIVTSGSHEENMEFTEIETSKMRISCRTSTAFSFQSGKDTHKKKKKNEKDDCDPDNSVWYFEIEILKDGDKGVISIGLTPEKYNMLNPPGTGKDSYGYQGDDGNKFVEGTSCKVNDGYGEGDTVGCGVDFYNKFIFYTLNGKLIELGAIDIPGYSYYPTVSMTSGGKIRASFSKFKYDFTVPRGFLNIPKRGVPYVPFEFKESEKESESRDSEDEWASKQVKSKHHKKEDDNDGDDGGSDGDSSSEENEEKEEKDQALQKPKPFADRVITFESFKAALNELDDSEFPKGSITVLPFAMWTAKDISKVMKKLNETKLASIIIGESMDGSSILSSAIFNKLKKKLTAIERKKLKYLAENRRSQDRQNNKKPNTAGLKRTKCNMIVEIPSFSYNRLAFGKLGKNENSCIKLSVRFNRQIETANIPAVVIHDYISPTGNRKVLPIKTGDSISLFGASLKKRSDWVKALKVDVITDKFGNTREKRTIGFVPSKYIKVESIASSSSIVLPTSPVSNANNNQKVPPIRDQPEDVDELNIPIDNSESQHRFIYENYYGAVSGGNYRFFFPDIDVDALNSPSLEIKLQLLDPKDNRASDEKLTVVLADEIYDMFSTIRSKKESLADSSKYYECAIHRDDLLMKWSSRGNRKPPNIREINLTGLTHNEREGYIPVPLTPPDVPQLVKKHLLNDDGSMVFGFIDLSVHVIESHRDGVDLFHLRIPPSVRLTTTARFDDPKNQIYQHVLNEFTIKMNGRFLTAKDANDSMESRMRKGKACEFRIQDMWGNVYNSIKKSFPGRIMEVVAYDAPKITMPFIKGTGFDIKNTLKESNHPSDGESEETTCCRSTKKSSVSKPDFFQEPIYNIKIAAMVIWNMREKIQKQMVKPSPKRNVAGKLVRLNQMLLNKEVEDIDLTKIGYLNSPLQIFRYSSAGIYVEVFKLMLSEWWMEPLFISTIALQVIQLNIENDEPGPWEKIKSDCDEIIDVVISSVPTVHRKRLSERCNCCDCCGSDESPYYYIVGNMITQNHERMMNNDMKSIIAAKPIYKGVSNVLWDTRSIGLTKSIYITPTLYHATQFFLYLIFLALLTYNISGMVRNGELNLKNQVSDDLFGGDSNSFDSITDISTFWQWFIDHFLSGLEGANTNKPSQYKLFDNVIVRQIHFDPDAEKCPATIAKNNVTCYTQTLSDWNPSVNQTWQGSEILDITSKIFFDPFGNPLPRNIFTEVLYLSSGFTSMKLRADQLRNQSWIDLGTRYLSIEYLIYSPNADIYLGGGVVVIFDNTGKVTAKEDKKTYANRNDEADTLSIIEIVLLCYYVGFIVQESFEIVYAIIKYLRLGKGSLWDYLKDLWNLLDILIIVTGVLSIFLSKTLAIGIDMKTFWDITLQLQWSMIMGSLCIIASWIRILNYMIPLNGFGTLVITLLSMIASILRWVTIFIAILVGFSTAFTVLYGASDPSVANWPSAVLTTVQRTFGGFQLPSYSNILADPMIIVGLILQIIYLIITVIILLNLLIALINTSYNDIQETAETEYRWQLSLYLGELSGLWPIPFNIVQMFVYIPLSRLLFFVKLPCFTNFTLGWIGSENQYLSNWKLKIEMVTEMHSHFWKGLEVDSDDDVNVNNKEDTTTKQNTSKAKSPRQRFTNNPSIVSQRNLLKSARPNYND